MHYTLTTVKINSSLSKFVQNKATQKFKFVSAMKWRVDSWPSEESVTLLSELKKIVTFFQK